MVLLDNLHRNALKETELLSHPNVTLIQGDVMDFGTVRSAVEGCKIIVHMASIAGVDTVMKSPVTTMKLP